MDAAVGEQPVDSQNYQAEQAAGSAQRDGEGRFVKGASGNPAGRPKGARNQATRMAERLLDHFAAKLTAEAIHQALQGDSVALRFCLARIIAPRRTPAVTFELPQVNSAADLVGAMSALTAATADGTLAPSEAGELARLLESSLRMIEARRQHAREEDERAAAESAVPSP